MKIRSTKDVWIATSSVAIIACLIVATAVFLIYPREDWAFELRLSLSLTIAIATPTTYFLTTQLLKNWWLRQELERLVNRDRLTDVATRDYFFARMSAAPHSYGVSLMVDIDHFKQVNDTYGHFAGDEVIRRVAKMLHGSVCGKDIVARFGGEEFVVFLYDHDPQVGFLVAERMRVAIAEQSFSFQDIPVNVTVSIGGSLKVACDEIEVAIQAADVALYQAKAGGRNRTIFGQNDDKVALISA